MNRILFALVLTLIAGFVIPAQADTDYRCLNVCVDSGKAAIDCRDQCTYNPAIPNTKKAPAPQGHKIFEAPQPFNGIVLDSSNPAEAGNLNSKIVAINPAHKKGGASGKDYQCIKQCLQGGLQYQLCDQSCTKSDCRPGSAICRGTEGAVSGNIGSGTSR